MPGSLGAPPPSLAVPFRAWRAPFVSVVAAVIFMWFGLALILMCVVRGYILLRRRVSGFFSRLTAFSSFFVFIPLRSECHDQAISFLSGEVTACDASGQGLSVEFSDIVHSCDRDSRVGDVAELIARQISQIVQLQHATFAKPHNLRQRQTLNAVDVLRNAQFRPARFKARLLSGNVIKGAALKLFCDIVVKAFNAAKFCSIDIGNFFNGRESFSDQQMRDDLINIKRVDECLGTNLGLFLAAL